MCKKIDIPYAKNFWRQNQAKIEHILQFLKIIKKSHRVAALTTIPKEWFEFKKSKFKLDDYFEIIVSSGEYGVRKPDLEIYEIILEKLNTKPKDILFIDDLKHNLYPAQKLGMQTVLFKGQEELIRELKARGLNL